jgi:xylulokinase
MLGNRNVDCNISGISFYNHTRAHLLRAVQEGVAFSLCYGIEIMRQMGIRISNINAGNANMFLSPLFRTTLSNVSRTTINIMQTDGSIGAARAAGIGAGIYKDNNEAFSQLKRIMVIEPETEHQEQYQEAFMRWKDKLNTILTH